MTAVTNPRIASRDEWLQERVQLLAAEKELSQRRDDLAQARRRLPWVRVEQDYRFDTVDGERSLTDLFDRRSQLVVYHFMFGPGWEEGCPSCSFWADNYDGITVHLAHRDTTLIAVSRAPLAILQEYRKRMDWSFNWVSSLDSTFNQDYGVSQAATYNYSPAEHPMEESPGLSAFARRDNEVFHTYSCYSRGLDVFNTAYQILDVTAKGRDEETLPWPMAWLRRHDQY